MFIVCIVTPVCDLFVHVHGLMNQMPLNCPVAEIWRTGGSFDINNKQHVQFS
jgi:hypothetical protein